VGLRGKGLEGVATNLVATYKATKILENIVSSPFVDAGFDVLGLDHIRELAFYTGDSKAIQTFVEEHIEDMAQAGRHKVLADRKNTTEKLERITQVADRFYDATATTLSGFNKYDINALFSAPASSSGEVLDKNDLLIVRQMGVAAIKGQALNVRF